MIVKITAIVPKGEEAQFKQAMEDGDFTWMQAIDPQWVEVVESDYEAQE